MESRTILLLHGAGGAVEVSEWVTPLNRRLSEAGYSSIGAESDNVIAPAYLNSLMYKEDEGEPKTWWQRPDDRPFTEARLRFASNSFKISEELRFDQSYAGPHWGHIPERLIDSAADGVIQGWPEIRRYAFNKGGRWAAQRAVLRSIPTTQRLVIVVTP